LCNSYVSDVTKDEESRSKALAMNGSILSVGWLIGIFLGGSGVSWGFSYRDMAFLAAFLEIIDLFVILFFLQEPEKKKVSSTQSSSFFFFFVFYIFLF